MNFDDAFAAVVGEEGGFSTDRKDPGNWTKGFVGGGLLLGTKYGISAAAYPLLDISNLSLSDAKAIYERDYWSRIGGPSLAYGNALCLFDFAVNAGIKESVTVAQRAVGATTDGVMGPNTFAAINAMPPAVFVPLFTQCRIEAYRAMKNFDLYGGGWVARAEHIAKEALA
jgi:lysozyme family protein